MQYKRIKNIRTIKILFVFFVIITIINIWGTYAKYYEEVGTNFSSNIKRWRFKINDKDIIEENEIEEYLNPKFLKNENINNDVIVPGTIGYFDFLIDYSEVDLDFFIQYDIIQTNVNKNIDFKILGYYVSDEFDIENIEDGEFEINKITNIETKMINSREFEENDEIMNHGEAQQENEKKRRICIFFTWDDSENNNLNDIQDTQYILSEKNENQEQVFMYKLKLIFKQIV